MYVLRYINIHLSSRLFVIKTEIRQNKQLMMKELLYKWNSFYLI